MKSFIFILTMTMSLMGKTFAQDNKNYNCVSYGAGLNLTYRLTKIPNDQFRMIVIIEDPLTTGKISGVFILTQTSGLRFNGVGKLSNGNELRAHIQDDFGRFHDLTLTGFSAPLSHSVIFSCED